MTKPLRIIFMGTPDFAVPALRNLASGSAHEVICAYTQPPRPKGRGQMVQPSPVHLAADEHGIEVRTPKNFKNDIDIAEFLALEADVAVVAAYGLILPKEILDAPKYGCLNIHASLLPRWRGASPIHRAVWAGDAETGITIMQMDEGLDTGPMIVKRAVHIRPESTSQSIHDELAAIGSAMIEEVLDELSDKQDLPHELQDDAASTYAPMLKKEDGRIDWNQSAVEIDRQVRALNPWPGTFCEGFKIPEVALTDDKTDATPGTVLNKQGHVACGAGDVLQLLKIQPQSKKPMDIASALNGGYLKVGEKLQ